MLKTAVPATATEPRPGIQVGGEILICANLSVGLYVWTPGPNGIPKRVSLPAELAALGPETLVVAASHPSGTAPGLGWVGPGSYGFVTNNLTGIGLPTSFMVYDIKTGDTVIISANLSASPVTGENAAVELGKVRHQRSAIRRRLANIESRANGTVSPSTSPDRGQAPPPQGDCCWRSCSRKSKPQTESAALPGRLIRPGRRRSLSPPS